MCEIRRNSEWTKPQCWWIETSVGACGSLWLTNWLKKGWVYENNKKIEREKKIIQDMVEICNDKTAKLEEVTKEQNDARNE